MTTATPPMLRLHRNRACLMQPPCLAPVDDRCSSSRITLNCRRFDLSRCSCPHRAALGERSEHKRPRAHAMGTEAQGSLAHFCTSRRTEEHGLAGRQAARAVYAKAARSTAYVRSRGTYEPAQALGGTVPVRTLDCGLIACGARTLSWRSLSIVRWIRVSEGLAFE